MLKSNETSSNGLNQNQTSITATRTSKIIIPYDRWIKYDCKKWGHFKDFDFYNLYLTPSASSNSNTNNNTNNNNNNIIITIKNVNSESSNSFIISTTLNQNSAIFSSSLSSNEQSTGPLHYVNGHFFKPIERLGDSQFILSQWPLNDIIVTVPCNIERYKPNDKQSKQNVLRLNRVIGVCEKFLVFQIWKGNNEVEIFIYEYFSSSSTSDSIQADIQSNNRIVRKLNRRFNSRTYACLISPDKNFLLITPDYEYNYSYSHHTHSHPESTVILNINTFAILRVIPARCDQRFAFDPRFGLPNHTAPRFAEFDNVRGQIFDLSMEKVIVCSNHTLKTKVFRVEYTKDGYLIIVICTLPVFQRRARRNYFIYILNSSTLLHMRSIIDYRGPLLSTYMFSNDFNLLFNMYPSLSNCASSIAVLKNIEPSQDLRVIELYSLPVCSMSLKELCRRVILRHVDMKHLNRLPLPPKLISYLSFNNSNCLNSKLTSQYTTLNNANINLNGKQMINSLKKNISVKCNSFTNRFNKNKKSITNFVKKS